MIKGDGLGGSYNIDHANRDTSMKFRTPTQFDALKKIGDRPQLKFAPDCYFETWVLGPSPFMEHSS